MKYQLADLINGQYGEVFTDKAVAEQALKDAIAEGKRLNLENSGGETDVGSYNGQTQAVEDFIYIVEIAEHKLRTNFTLKAADSEADVHVIGKQFPVGSIAAHEILKMLKQKGDTLTHKFQRRAKNGQIVTKEYSFDRANVEDFVRDCMIENHDFLVSSNQEFFDRLRSGPAKKV